MNHMLKNPEQIHWTLVTGGAKRLGAEICRTLASKGHHIVVHYNKSQQEASEVVDQCRTFRVHSECIQGDFSSCETTRAFIQDYLKKFPTTTNLINNVGNYQVQSALMTSEEEWLNLFQTNLHAPVILIKALETSLKNSKGCVVNLGMAGLVTLAATPYATAYKLTKMSLLMLTKSLARELASSGVRVNMVSPGYLDSSIDVPKEMAKLPMGRLGTEHEVAGMIAFLLEKESAYITGQNIEVAGAVGL